MEDGPEHSAEWDVDPFALVLAYTGKNVVPPPAAQYEIKQEELQLLDEQFKQLLRAIPRLTIGDLKAQIPETCSPHAATALRCFVDNTEVVDFETFVEFTIKLTECALLHALEVLDHEKCGWIDQAIFVAVIKDVLGEQYNQREIGHVLKQLPTDDAQRMLYGKFVKQWLRFNGQSRTLVNQWQRGHPVRSSESLTPRVQ